MTKIPYDHWVIGEKKYGWYESLPYWANFLEAVRNEAGGDREKGRIVYQEWARQWKFTWSEQEKMLTFESDNDATLFLLRWS